MPDVYVAPEPHRCDVSSFFWLHDNNMIWYPKGSIWQCDECGKYWVMNRRPTVAREPLSVQHQRIWSTGVRPLVIKARFTEDWPKDQRWRVYTMYEITEAVRVPLYVGCTHQLHARLGQHRRNRAWWPLVGAIVVEHYDTRSDALDAEHARIRVMQPLFNIAGNVHNPGLEDTA